ncbi:MAG: hypothetical protein KKF46_08445 [Nanoarchaeota archaeon]|nr:hypothetical protein [Nanoarchaeota archaeon]MBU1322359.1 hypothetical protein [Nanoarchaeota archaeon]MBU1596972.1 hypothetical protein [Nanoarchaeota archaeon]MBU2441693.1 hypothetical protein [Nanoarchaeota archaeon]
MVKLDILFREHKISRIKETELERYTDFFTNSYKDNLMHAKANVNEFPRWSIISGYYAMHDISKLLIAKVYRLKIEQEVHATTIKVLRELIKDKETLKLIEAGYEQFKNLANELSDAKKERVKVQYYTGTDFIRKKYERMAKEFMSDADIYLEKIRKIMEK